MEDHVMLITFDKEGRVETITVTSARDWAVNEFKKRTEDGLASTITNYRLGDTYKLNEEL